MARSGSRATVKTAVIVDSAHYPKGTPGTAAPFGLAEARRRSDEEPGFTWLAMSDPSSAEMEELRHSFELPALAVEDAQARRERPKLDRHGEDLFLLVKTVRYDEVRRVVDFGEINVFLGAHHAILIGRPTAAGLESARARLDGHPDLAELGPIVALWAVLDEVIDAYEPVLDRLADDVERTEQAVFQRGLDQGERIYVQYRRTGRIIRALHPLLGMLEAAEDGGGAPDVPVRLRPLVRDVGDHLRRLYDDVVLLGEALDRLLDANLAGVTLRQNQVLQRLSSWAAIAVVPTIITSVYGMNFRHMPELRWPVGYPLVLFLMITSVYGLWRYFRRLGWI
jgi:magnesium transporter